MGSVHGSLPALVSEADDTFSPALPQIALLLRNCSGSGSGALDTDAGCGGLCRMCFLRWSSVLSISGAGLPLGQVA